MHNVQKGPLSIIIGLFFAVTIARAATWSTDSFFAPLRRFVMKADLITLQEPILMPVVATGYSSESWQTDSTPLHTATGDHVFDGVIAANFLQFGTNVLIPEVFGDKVFVVKDRMNWRFNRYYPHHIDIWFPTTAMARAWGARTVNILVSGIASKPHILPFREIFYSPFEKKFGSML